jgi:hypothetical protein
MMTEVDGTVEFEDLVDGISVLEATDEVNRHHRVRSSTGVRRRAVPISSRQS